MSDIRAPSGITLLVLLSSTFFFFLLLSSSFFFFLRALCVLSACFLRTHNTHNIHNIRPPPFAPCLLVGCHAVLLRVCLLVGWLFVLLLVSWVASCRSCACPFLRLSRWLVLLLVCFVSSWYHGITVQAPCTQMPCDMSCLTLKVTYGVLVVAVRVWWHTCSCLVARVLIWHAWRVSCVDRGHACAKAGGS